MKKFKSLAKIYHRSFEEFYYSDLFNRFLKDFPKARILNKTIEFHLIYHWFSFYRIQKQEARKIIQEWIKLGFVNIIQFHGIKILSPLATPIKVGFDGD